ncbi:MAG TPA: S41 family peptidase [Planctomycetota bacterium]|nr:S41 family peptidase [Planctomycetota bacterium]
MNQLLRRGLSLSILLASCAQRNPTTELDVEAWRADLEFLARELPERHVNAFHTITREAFTAEVAGLRDALPQCNADQAVVGFMRIVALVGDGHTHLDLSPRSLRYPVEMEWFGDELRVVAAAVPYLAAVGARVLAIGTVPVAEVLERASQLVPRGENAGRTRLTATMQLGSPEVLHGLQIVADPEHAPFSLELASGEQVSLSLSPAGLGAVSSWQLATGESPPLYLQRLGEGWWTQSLPDEQAVYFSFTRFPQGAEFGERAQALGRLLDESRATRLVIDLRRNAGGDFTMFREIFLPMLQAREAIARKGGLFVIIGPGTFSAATVNALDLRNEAHAILVGAPTGMRPTHYGEHAEFRLPNSGLRISYATQVHRFGAESDSAVAPDRQIEPTWAEFRAGRDPVLEWILANAN